MVEEILISTLHVGIVVLSRGGDTIENIMDLFSGYLGHGRCGCNQLFLISGTEIQLKSLQHGKNEIKQ